MKNSAEEEWGDEDKNSSASDSVSPEEDEEELDDEDTQSFAEHVASSFLDQLIIRLMTARLPKFRSASITSRRFSRTSAIRQSTVPVELRYDELVKLCDMAMESFKQQKSLIWIEKSDLPIVVCGDIHGQFQDLREIFFKCGSPHRQSYLFMGDYVDRGAQGIPTLSLLLALKVKYPSKIFLLRGNHESSQTNLSYGFYDECLLQFVNSEENLGEKIWRKFVELFNLIPFASVICKTILCVHGGLSPYLNCLEDIEKIKRPCIIPAYGLACDLVWSDPKQSEGDGWSMSIRGISFTYSSSVIKDFCEKLDIDLIVRGHQMLNNEQMMRNGFCFFPGGKLLTLFSARNYTNLGNAGAVMRVGENLKCRFIVFRMRKPKIIRRAVTKHVHTSAGEQQPIKE